MYALEDMGKRVCVACDSKITKKFLFLTGEEDLEPRFKPDFIVAVDIASPQLLGKSMEEFADRIDLVIDHHPTNTRFARWNLVADTSSAAGIVVFNLFYGVIAVGDNVNNFAHFGGFIAGFLVAAFIEGVLTRKRNAEEADRDRE